MLTKGDDFPIHQTPEPIAYSGSIGISTTAISSTAIRRTAANSWRWPSGSIPR